MCDMREVGEEWGMTQGIEIGISKGIEIGISKGRAEGKAEGKAEGRAEGIEIGIAQEKIRSKIETVQILLDSNFSFAQALEKVKIDEETYNAYKDVYGKNNLS